MQVLIEVEMQQMEVDDLIEGRYFLIEIFKIEGLNYKDRGIDMDYEVVDGVYIDSGDERMLFYY